MDCYICEFCENEKPAKHVTPVMMHLICDECFNELPKEDQEKCMDIKEYDRLFNG